MPGFIPDASVTLPWCFPDEGTPWTESLLNRLAVGESAVVPAHWATEVMNGLLMATRRGRIGLAEVVDFVGILNDLLLDIEPPRLPASWPALLALAQKHRLTAYDAAYLELAQRRCSRVDAAGER